MISYEIDYDDISECSESFDNNKRGRTVKGHELSPAKIPLLRRIRSVEIVFEDEMSACAENTLLDEPIDQSEASDSSDDSTKCVDDLEPLQGEGENEDSVTLNAGGDTSDENSMSLPKDVLSSKVEVSSSNVLTESFTNEDGTNALTESLTLNEDNTNAMTESFTLNEDSVNVLNENLSMKDDVAHLIPECSIAYDESNLDVNECSVGNYHTLVPNESLAVHDESTLVLNENLTVQDDVTSQNLSEIGDSGRYTEEACSSHFDSTQNQTYDDALLSHSFESIKVDDSSTAFSACDHTIMIDERRMLFEYIDSNSDSSDNTAVCESDAAYIKNLTSIHNLLDNTDEEPTLCDSSDLQYDSFVDMGKF